MTSKMHSYITLSQSDNISIALKHLSKGENINNILIQEDIKPGFKFANQKLKIGDSCIRYGSYIGNITRNTNAGACVHTHNLEYRKESAPEIKPSSPPQSPDLKPLKKDYLFDGYVRNNGDVATRNYIGVISTVNCANTVVDEITNYFRFGEGQKLIQSINTNVSLIDGVVPIKHNLGCAMEKNGSGHQLLRNTVSGYAQHPNFCFVIVIGLGCEVNDMSYLAESVPSLKFLSIQKSGGSRKCSDAGINLVQNFLNSQTIEKRVPLPISHLKISLQCGGSDSLSGITANPLLGHSIDKIINAGGTAVLGETPEIYGAEHLLLQRALNNKISDKLKEKILWWEKYTSNLGESMNNNPSLGNIEGGISNIAEKSLGAIAKSGGTALVDVIDYSEKITKSGLIFMDTPGYDPVSVTGHIAGGCNLVCFTTGRGSAFGSFPSPTIKISSNSKLFKTQAEDIDFDAGVILSSNANIQDLADKLLITIIAIASGKKSKSESLGYGYNEFVPWHLGAVL